MIRIRNRPLSLEYLGVQPIPNKCILWSKAFKHFFSQTFNLIYSTSTQFLAYTSLITHLKLDFVKQRHWSYELPRNGPSHFQSMYDFNLRTFGDLPTS